MSETAPLPMPLSVGRGVVGRSVGEWRKTPRDESLAALRFQAKGNQLDTPPT
jgi:hypothetical protein